MVTNGAQAARLLMEAGAVVEEARGAREKSHYNLAVRRSQEVVELAEKAVLLWAGRDYPHVHDVAPTVKSTLSDRGIALTHEFADWLLEESADLARKRAPAFYGETDMSAADAERAVASAERVLAWANGLIGQK